MDAYIHMEIEWVNGMEYTIPEGLLAVDPTLANIVALHHLGLTVEGSYLLRI